MPPSPGTRIIDHDNTFFSGVKSDSDPSQIPLGYAWMAVNMLNVGGTMSCRPGYRCIVTLPDGNLQGGKIFRPTEGMEQMVVVIDGVVYVAPWPFTHFQVLAGLQFSPYARQVFFEQAAQSAERIDDSFTSAIRVVPLRALLIIQDGGLSAPAWYDGTNAAHDSGKLYGIPAGGEMKWVGDRLWVASGKQVFASDISNPRSFRESDYLGGQVSFFFRSEVTAMEVTPSIEAPQLMVFTDSNGSILQANIRDRSTWNTTANFQEEVIGVGCTAPRSLLAHYGRLIWYSTSGVAIYDPATSGKLTTRLPVRDNEMLVSKATVSEDLVGVAAGSFGQYLLMSVPAEDVYNRHTWVLNGASLTSLADDSGPSWSGYWLGTRPVEWMSGQVANTERIFHISVDFDGKNRLWEAFLTDRLDDKCPIMWALLTRGYFGATAAIQEKPPGIRCRLAWADIALAGIEEDLNVGVFYAGGTRGAFRQMMNKLVSVEKGSLKYDQELTADSSIYAFKPQSRQLRTEDANQQVPDSDQGSCGVETDDQDNIDRNFQLLIVGHGPATIKWIRPFAFLVPEDLSGDPTACENETPVNAVRFDGVGSDSPNYAEAVAELAVKPLADYTSHQTVSVEQNGFTAIGVGFGESVVSQEVADRVASVVATRMAENELTSVNPLITSTGLGVVRPAGPSNYGAVVTPDSTLPESGCPAVLFLPLASATEGDPYSQQLISRFGVEPLVYTQVTGGMPPGLTLSSTGLISGTPSAAGLFSFEVRVRDANGNQCQQAVGLTVQGNFGTVDWDSINWTFFSAGGGDVHSLIQVPGHPSQFSYDLLGGYPATSDTDAWATLIGTVLYTGPAATAELRLNVTGEGNNTGPAGSSVCSVSLRVTQNGAVVRDTTTVSPNNPDGSAGLAFGLNSGINTIINVTLTIRSGRTNFGPFNQQPMTGAGQFRNL